MAYYLYHVSASDLSGKYVDFPEVNIATSQDFEFEFEAFSTNSTFFRPFGRVENLNSRCLFLTDNVTIRLTNNAGTNLNWTVPAYTRTNFNVFKFTRASNVITLYINGVASGTPITNNGAFVFSRFFANGASAGITGAMKYFKISIGGSLVRNYVNSTGTGSVLPDIVSAQDGNQVGPWPSDGSEWVFYSSGASNESTIAYDIGAIDYAASSNVTAPNATAAIGYDIGAITFAASSTVSAPATTATISYDIGSVSFVTSATVGVRNTTAFDIGSVDYSISASATSNASAVIAFDIGEINFDLSALVVSNISTTISYDIGAIDFDVYSTIPTNEPERSLMTKDNVFWRNSIFFKSGRI